MSERIIDKERSERDGKKEGWGCLGWQMIWRMVCAMENIAYIGNIGFAGGVAFVIS